MHNVGDRIELLKMPDDPDPIPVGTQGIISQVFSDCWHGKEFVQYTVEWEIPRSLAVVVPPDEIRAIE